MFRGDDPCFRIITRHSRGGVGGRRDHPLGAQQNPGMGRAPGRNIHQAIARLALFEAVAAGEFIRLAAVAAVFIAQGDLRANRIVIVNGEIERQPAILQHAPNGCGMLHHVMDVDTLHAAGANESRQRFMFMDGVQRERKPVVRGEAFQNHRALRDRPQVSARLRRQSIRLSGPRIGRRRRPIHG